MSTPSGTEPGRLDERSIRKIAALSLVGASVEWFDFFLYGTAAALVFGHLFFSNLTPVVATIASFGTLAVGYVVRPLGGVIFGHFGDRIGRKSMLIATLLLMGLATFAIGCLPTYSQIGVAAPLILVVLRFLQGLGLGGEWGGAVLMAVEHSPEDRRGFYGSFPQMGIPAGVIFSSLIFLVLTSSLSRAGPLLREVLGWVYQGLAYARRRGLVLFAQGRRARALEMNMLGEALTRIRRRSPGGSRRCGGGLWAGSSSPLRELRARSCDRARDRGPDVVRPRSEEEAPRI
jgi:MFS family permease